jgi:hypothetical protein
MSLLSNDQHLIWKDKTEQKLAHPWYPTINDLNKRRITTTTEEKYIVLLR